VTPTDHGQTEALGQVTEWCLDAIDKRDARIAELERDLDLARVLNEGTFRANKRMWDVLTPDQRAILQEEAT
jgi:hypothetical protein